jgi:hypothetical protein
VEAMVVERAGRQITGGAAVRPDHFGSEWHL